MDFVVINGNEDHAVIPQQVAGKEETGIHHRKPVGVELAVLLAVLPEKSLLRQIPLFVLVANPLQVLFLAFRELVGINEAVVSRIIRRIDVDHLYLAVVRLLQNLQHFQVLPFNEDVLCRVEVHRLFLLRLERAVVGAWIALKASDFPAQFRT